MDRDLSERMPVPRIGLLPTGHKIYWAQFPELKQLGLSMYEKYLTVLAKLGDVVTYNDAPVDTPEKSKAAGDFFKRKGIDILLIFPFGYTTGMVVVPAVQQLDNHIPIRLINSHEDASYDYKSADTTVYLHHEGVCCIPEYAGTLKRLHKEFVVRSGALDDERMWKEIESDCQGAAAARGFRNSRFAIIGDTYTNMTDMPTDEHRILAATGQLIIRPEIEEIHEAAIRVTESQLKRMYDELRNLYRVDDSVTNEHMRESARLCVAYEEIVRKHDINAFGYYWWGKTEEITQLRSDSALAVSRLASLGCPGVTEGDLKTAMAMRMLDLMGAGGFFLEFFSMDFEDDFIMMGHDGPSNINMAKGQPRLQHLEVHHGKTGRGLGIDFEMYEGPVTLVNLTQFYEGDLFKIIYSVGEIIDGDLLNIGNPNCRVRVAKNIPEFVNDWCQQGPCHHIAMGYGDLSLQLETFGESMSFPRARV